MTQLWAGVDIGGTKTAIVLSAKPPEVVYRREISTLPAKGPGRVLDWIKQNIGEMLTSCGAARMALAGIGVSCGSPLDRVAGVMQAPPNLRTWVDVPIADILSREFACPCRLENDANAGAVAEHRFGAGKGLDHMVFLTLGTGLGAGIIANGHLYHGAADSAGEIGHVRLSRTGPVGYHKAGSVEGWVSGGGIAQLAGRAVADACMKGKRRCWPRPAATASRSLRAMWRWLQRLVTRWRRVSSAPPAEGSARRWPFWWTCSIRRKS